LHQVSIQLSGKAFGSDFSSAGAQNVARHEVGHALGLGHSDDEEDLMFPSFEFAPIFGEDNVPISACDVHAVEDIYGAVSCAAIRIRQIAHSKSCVATLAAPIFFLAQDLTRGYAWRKRNTFSLSHRQGPHPDSSPAPCRLCGLYTHTWAFSGKPRPAGSAARRPASARTPGRRGSSS
jgi:hypothetical protein